jgi:hypothetical protein
MGFQGMWWHAGVKKQKQKNRKTPAYRIFQTGGTGKNRHQAVFNRKYLRPTLISELSGGQ